MVKVYKKTNYKSLQNRSMTEVDMTTKNKIGKIITDFVKYFKEKHLN
jgi:hypothetical protein